MIFDKTQVLPIFLDLYTVFFLTLHSGISSHSIRKTKRKVFPRNLQIKEEVKRALSREPIIIRQCDLIHNLVQVFSTGTQGQSISWKSRELPIRTLKKSFVEFTKNPFQAISKATFWKLPAASGKYLQVLLKVLEKQLIYATVCSCHVTYMSQSESALYSCLNFKELLARSRREIWSLSDCNWTRTQNHLVRKRTLNHWAKLA